MSAVLTESTIEELVSRNPASGAEIGRVRVTPPEQVGELVARSRRAQASWAATPCRQRLRVVDRWRRILSRDAETWAALIRSEIGKPWVEAYSGDVLSSLDAMRWTVRHAARSLSDRWIGPAWQRMLLMPGARLRQVPLGVVGMLGTWNYPLFLNAPPIAQALAAGNGVVWKASELAPLCGALLQKGVAEAGFPEGLVSVVQGGPAVGGALLEAGIDKVMFTGGVANGRRVLEAAGRLGIPATAELSGFDPAIVLPDAPLESTVRALTWAAFVGCGQTCVAVKRVLVVGDPVPWAEALAAAARALRLGDPATGDVDVGPMISDRARDQVHAMIGAAAARGARIVAGGETPPGPGSFYPPTVLAGGPDQAEDALAGAFGPVVLVRGFATTSEAVDAANRSQFALAASVWGRDRAAAGQLARQLQAGMVSINDAVTATAHAGLPFGGTKASGYGRTKGDAGLAEFTQTQAIVTRAAGGLRPQLYPYPAVPLLDRFLTVYRSLFHPRLPR